MDPLSLLKEYHPELTDAQYRLFARLPELYSEWNARINVISRKDIDNFVVHHLLHSLSISKLIYFKSGTHIIDVGTGGGLPGIPLAIYFPECRFSLVESIRKKVTVASDIIESIGLENVALYHVRAEEAKMRADFVVSRAAMSLPDLVKVSARLISHDEQRNTLPNGIIALKGGDLSEETSRYKKTVSIEDLGLYYNLPYFETKKIVYLPV